MIQGKKIILGITGSIAAYKAASLVRLLIKEGASVKVVVTPTAKEFITPVTLSALSREAVLCDFFDYQSGSWNSHVELGIWADLLLIAPATANTIAKMANGICDNLLLTTYLSARCQVIIAPAMDVDMFKHPTIQKNIKTLQSFGNIIIEPETGELASGLDGKGRMAEPETIVRFLNQYFTQKLILKDYKFLVTSGPTHEAIDKVRFVSNYSTGKMGNAIAERILELGGNVVLVTGPVLKKPEHPNLKLISVVSAAQMFEACINNFFNVDVAILAAAVADYSPVINKSGKIKKTAKNMNLKLSPTIDIAATLGREKKENQLIIGFALEIENEIENAKQKLKKKNLDFIVLNSLKDKGAGFGGDNNKISIIDKNNIISNYQLKPKSEVARDIVSKICTLLKTSSATT